jgi:hypothetical protein
MQSAIQQICLSLNRICSITTHGHIRRNTLIREKVQHNRLSNSDKNYLRMSTRHASQAIFIQVQYNHSETLKTIHCLMTKKFLIGETRNMIYVSVLFHELSQLSTNYVWRNWHLEKAAQLAIAEVEDVVVMWDVVRHLYQLKDVHCHNEISMICLVKCCHRKDKELQICLSVRWFEQQSSLYYCTSTLQT